MSRFSAGNQTFFYLFATATAVIFLIKFIFGGYDFLYPDFAEGYFSAAWSKLEIFKKISTEALKWRELANENEELRKQNKELTQKTTLAGALEEENKFLRRTVGITAKIPGRFVLGGIYNLNLTPSDYNVLLNRGSKNGVSEGDIVITAEGILVGQVKQVFGAFSKLLFITDPAFKISGKISRSTSSGQARSTSSRQAGSETKGLVKGRLNEELYFDLITRKDTVKEGDLVVSSGDDTFPPALIIGTVSFVAANETGVFQTVKIRPAVNGESLAKILIMMR